MYIFAPSNSQRTYKNTLEEKSLICRSINLASVIIRNIGNRYSTLYVCFCPRFCVDFCTFKFLTNLHKNED